MTHCRRGHELAITRVFKGKSTRCVICLRMANLKAQQTWKKANPLRFRRNARADELKRKYGITEADIQSLILSQSNGCAICGTSDWGPRGPNVDHDHDTKIVRGILCNNCNLALGLFDENINMMRRAILYIEKAAVKQAS